MVVVCITLAVVPLLNNVIFNKNSSLINGGGMSNYASNPSLMNVTFSANSSSYGGAMYNSNSNPSLQNVNFDANSADYGGE